MTMYASLANIAPAVPLCDEVDLHQELRTDRETHEFNHA